MHQYSQRTKGDHYHPVIAGDLVIIVNLDKYNSLPPHLQDVLAQAHLNIEPRIRDTAAANVQQGTQGAIDAGLTLVEFTPDDAAWYTALAASTSWDAVKDRLTPESQAKMKAFLEP